MHVGVKLDSAPRMLREIVVDALQAEADLDVHELHEIGGALAEAAAKRGLDALVVCMSDESAAHPPIELLYARPGLRVIAIRPHGRSASLFELLPHVYMHEDLAPKDIARLLRARPGGGL